MPVMDEFREEREAIKNAGFKEKWEYFWEYYKWYVIGGAAIIILLTIFIRDMVNKKDWILRMKSEDAPRFMRPISNLMNRKATGDEN